MYTKAHQNVVDGMALPGAAGYLTTLKGGAAPGIMEGKREREERNEKEGRRDQNPPSFMTDRRH